MITFSAVTKQFGNGSPALDDVSFHIDKGEFVFLTGPSGSGKSTLLKIITKEYTPTSGEVTFDDVILNKLKGSQIHHHRRKIGVVFQDYRLLPDLNVWENIALALQIIGKPQHEIEERVTDLLELVQLTDKAYNFPTQLSGGESQRVGIARALATAPGVLLADEPTGNLDPQNTMMIAKLFDRIHDLGTTILFATHDLGVLSALNHRRIHLEKGKISHDTGTPKTVENLEKEKEVTEAKEVKDEKVAKPEKPEKAEKIEKVDKSEKEKVEKPEKPKKKTRLSFPSFPSFSSLSLPFRNGKKEKDQKPETDVVIQIEELN